MEDNAEGFYIEIREAIERGIINDIYRADEAVHMFTAISDHAEFVNSDRGYGNMCHAIQNSCIATLLLALTRIPTQSSHVSGKQKPQETIKFQGVIVWLRG